MPQLHETYYGKRFFDVQLPALVKALEKIAKDLERSNDEKEEESGQNEKTTQ